MAIKSFILVESDGVKWELKKNNFLGVRGLGHPYCSSSNNTENSTECESTCPFHCEIGSSIPTFRDMHLHVIVQKKLFYNFLYKTHHIYLYKIYKKRQL